MSPARTWPALRRLPIAACAVAALALAGCASPGITVTSVSIEEQAADAVRLGVDVDLTNPASDSMRLLRWDYTFSSGGESYRGTWEALTTLPPGTTVHRRVPVVLPLGAADAAGRSWTISGSLSYRSPSRIAEIFYDLGIWRPSTSFGGSSAEAAAAQAAQPAQTDQPAPPAGSR